MLQSLRENLKGAVAVFVIGIFVVPLVITGFIGSEYLFSGGGQSAGSVNGEEITVREFQQQLRDTKARMMQQFNLEPDSPQLDDATLTPTVLERIARRKALFQRANEGGMDFGIDALKKWVFESEYFREDGKYSSERFQQVLLSTGQTPAAFFDELRKDQVITQVNEGIQQSAFVTQAEVAQIAAIVQQKRDFYTVKIPPVKKEDVTITDDEIQTYYQENAVRFTDPEQVKVAYLELSLATLAEEMTVSEQDLQSAYEQEVAEFNSDPVYNVAHILIEDKDGAAEKIQQVTAGLAEGKTFEALAGEFSDDLGSKDVGGNLGELLEDAYPSEFVAAAKALEAGAVSAAVETDAGTHFIKLVSVDNAEPPSFEERKAAIEAQLARDLAMDLYLEKLSELRNLTFGAQTLDEAAQALNLEVQESDFFARAGGSGIAADSSVAKAAFSDTVKNDGIASEVLELPGDKAVVVKMIEHKEEAVRPLEVVKSDVVDTLTEQKIREQSAQASESLLADIKSGKAPEAIAEEKGYEFKKHEDIKRTDFGVNRAVVQKAFTMPRPVEDNKAVLDTAADTDGGSFIVGLTSVTDGSLADMPEAQQKGIVGQLENQVSQTERVAFEQAVFNSSKVVLGN